MAKFSRDKGARGERELARLLGAELGVDLCRNLEQTRDGGADLLGVARFAIEVKRHEKISLGPCWRQALRQAESIHMKPCLAYRANNQPWRFMVLMSDLNAFWFNGAETATLDLEGFCLLVRESL